MTEVIASNESVVNRYRYTPFGQSIVKEESVYNPYQYTGRRFDEERGNYYYRARIYDQQQSRFLSNDPAGQGANLYAYVGNITWNSVPGIEGNSTNFLLNPTNRMDPSGEQILPAEHASMLLDAFDAYISQTLMCKRYCIDICHCDLPRWNCHWFSDIWGKPVSDWCWQNCMDWNCNSEGSGAPCCPYFGLSILEYISYFQKGIPGGIPPDYMGTHLAKLR